MRASARELLVPFFTPLVWCGRDSIPRPPAPKADALPTELSGDESSLVKGSDFQQCGILTSVDSNEPVQPPFKQMMFSELLYTHRIFKRLAKALIRLRVCTGCSEALLVAHNIAGNIILCQFP